MSTGSSRSSRSYWFSPPVWHRLAGKKLGSIQTSAVPRWSVGGRHRRSCRRRSFSKAASFGGEGRSGSRPDAGSGGLTGIHTQGATCLLLQTMVGQIPYRSVSNPPAAATAWWSPPNGSLASPPLVEPASSLSPGSLGRRCRVGSSPTAASATCRRPGRRVRTRGITHVPRLWTPSGGYAAHCLFSHC